MIVLMHVVSGSFLIVTCIEFSEEGLLKDAEQAEEAIKTANGNDVEKNAEAASLRAARAVDVARQVLAESDDPRYAESLTIAAKEVEKGMKPDIMSIYPRALFFA